MLVSISMLDFVLKERIDRKNKSDYGTCWDLHRYKPLEKRPTHLHQKFSVGLYRFLSNIHLSIIITEIN
jgi:hypothetical protein